MVSEICVILKKTSGRGWGSPRASTLGAFNLSIHPDHKYIWFRGGDLNHYKVHFRKGVGYNPRGLSYKAFNLPSHPDHKYIWFKGGDLHH
jgi:hypothetical protein